MDSRTKRKFHYVYILESINQPEHYYTGFTENLKIRLNAHNTGKCLHTIKFKPWKLKSAVAFTNYDKAVSSKKYLKTSSGRAFAKKRL
ncbi:MAG: GIY-YIG nuclease family protein [Deltaproteobacteria bacterium]|nr:GIY-YIG nuclease family protein [Deltaproteobacteria bacterium]